MIERWFGGVYWMVTLGRADRVIGDGEALALPAAKTAADQLIARHRARASDTGGQSP